MRIASEIVKCSQACVHRGAALYQVLDFYLLPLMLLLSSNILRDTTDLKLKLCVQGSVGRLMLIGTVVSVDTVHVGTVRWDADAATNN